MDAIVTAGGIPQPKDPLYPITQGGYKVLLDINGKTMIQWIIDALNASSRIQRIVVVGLPQPAALRSRLPLTVLAAREDILANIQHGAEALLREGCSSDRALIVSGDVPAVTPAMLDWMADYVEQTDYDMYYPVVERGVMEARFPNSRRTYTRFRDVEICGGDVLAARVEMAAHNTPFSKKLIAARKNPLKQASLIGFDTLALLLTHRLSLAEAEVRVSKRLDVRGKAVLCPYAEMGMDVDKPYQLELMRETLSTGGGK